MATSKPVIVGAPGLLADPAVGFVTGDAAGLAGDGGVSDGHGQHRGAGERQRADLDVDVVEARVEQQVAVSAGDAGVGDGGRLGRARCGG